MGCSGSIFVIDLLEIRVSVHQTHASRTSLAGEVAHCCLPHIEQYLSDVWDNSYWRFCIENLLKSLSCKEVKSTATPQGVKGVLFRAKFTGIVVLETFLVFFRDKTVSIFLKLLKPVHIIYAGGQDNKVKLHPLSSQI